MSHRVAQIESTLKRAIAQVLATQLGDPRVEGLVSITDIKVTPDLKTAWVGVSVMPESSQRKTLQGLRHAAGRIRRLTAQKVSLPSMPTVEFRLDPGLKKQAAIESEIRKAMARTRQDAAAADPGNPQPASPPAASRPPDDAP